MATTSALNTSSDGVAISSLGLGLTGLASGLDTDSIITQLIAVDKQAQTPILNNQTKVTAEQTALKDVTSKLAALKTAADALSRNGGAFATSQSVESSDTTKVAVAKISGAGIGGHTLQVDRLASSAQDGFAIGDLSAGGTITVGSSSFSIAAGASPSSIADAINSSTTSPVYAAIVKNSAGDQRLVLSSRTTGESGRFTVSSSLLTEDPAYASAAGTLDAQYRIDGSSTVQTSESNTIDDAVAGLRLTLKGVTSSPVSVTVGAPDIDRDAVTAKVKAVVDAYNSLVDTARGYTTTKPPDPTSASPDLTQGVLFGDTGLNSMLSSLRDGLRQSLSGLTGVTHLSDLGIDVPKSTGSLTSDDANAGKFVIDDDKLSQALDGDWTGVANFLNAFSTQVDTLVGRQTGSPTSLLDSRITSDDKRLKDLQGQMSSLNDRLDTEQTRLKQQFAAMEAALSSAQSMQGWLTSQINSLP